jgi:hypothetical protein
VTPSLLANSVLSFVVFALQKPQRALAVLGVITLGMIFIMLGHYRTWRYQLNGNTWNTTLAVEMALGSWLMSGVSEENVMNLLNRVGWHGDCFLVSVHNRTVYTSFRPRARDDLLLFRRLSVLTLVETVARRDPQFPNVEFAMCVEDCVVSQFLHHPARHLGTVYKLVPDPLPAFTMVKCSGSANIPFPVWDLADGAIIVVPTAPAFRSCLFMPRSLVLCVLFVQERCPNGTR